MKDRISKIIAEEGLTAARFADEIGVQASGVSHILSGRNNPSTDFLIKVLERYRAISSDWLLLGKGEMYKSQNPVTPESSKTHDLFTQMPVSGSGGITAKSEKKELPAEVADHSHGEIEKIVVFYSNNTFRIYFRAT